MVMEGSEQSYKHLPIRIREAKTFWSYTAYHVQSAIWKRQCYLVGTRRRLQNAAKFSGGDHGLSLLLLVGGMISWLGGAQLFPDGWAPRADDLWHVLHCKPASHLDNTRTQFSWIFLKAMWRIPGCLSQIPNFSIPDPGASVKEIPDPKSGSASKNLSNYF